MHVLALDATTREGGAAIAVDDRILIERRGDPARTHAEQLPALPLQLLTDAGMAIEDVDIFAVAAGPGSFTGLRIGIATVQGLAFVTRKPVVPISALEALAQGGAKDAAPGACIAAWMDARRREVFSAVYRVEHAAPYSRHRLGEIEEPTVGKPSDIVTRWAARGLAPDLFVGDGAQLYASERGRHRSADGLLATPVLAGVVALMAVHRARAGEAVDPAAIQPLYVRRPDAVIARAARRAAAKDC
jgi:tRNA threonylcarbamoyladenosine biosynthesis protein TsaB